MESSDDVVCPDCGGDIIWEPGEVDMLGETGPDIPVGCDGPRCPAEKDMLWAPIPRAEYQRS